MWEQSKIKTGTLLKKSYQLVGTHTLNIKPGESFFLNE